MSQTTKKTILIVEDDVLMLRALCLLFDTGEFIVISATDGEVALKMTEEIKPDIVLLDLLLPKMTGFDYLKNLKSNQAIKNTTVVVLSNLGSQADVKATEALGVDKYFIKADIELEQIAKYVKNKLKV